MLRFPCGRAGLHRPQARTEITPFVGAYRPAADVFDRQDVVVAGDRSVLKHESAVVFGGRVGGTLNDRVGFEVAFGYAPSRAEAVYTDASNTETRTDYSASVFLGSLRLLLGVGPTSGIASVHFMLGASLTSHAGEAYDSLAITEGTTDVGGLVGVGARFKVGPSLAIRLDVEDYVYRTTMRNSSGVESESRFQNDVVVSLGLSIPFGSK